MHPRPWPVPLWVLLVSLLATAQAGATGRETRQGTVLVAAPDGAPAVLYVAARLSTLVDFEDLLEPRALLTPGLRERVGVVAVGPRSLVLIPARDLAEGERLLLPVTGRTRDGELRTLTLALVTRREEVDLRARVSFPSRESRGTEAAEEAGGDSVARMLLASQEPGTSPRLSLLRPGEGKTRNQAGDVHGWIESVLQLDRRRLFVTVAIETATLSSEPWRLARVRVEATCWGVHAGADEPLPTVVTSDVPGPEVQRHTLDTRLPEGAGCVSLSLEEDGPRTLRFEGVGRSP